MMALPGLHVLFRRKRRSSDFPRFRPRILSSSSPLPIPRVSVEGSKESSRNPRGPAPMGRAAPPRGGDLPVFPAASQFAGSSEVSTMRPTEQIRYNDGDQRAAQQAYRQKTYPQDPRQGATTGRGGHAPTPPPPPTPQQAAQRPLGNLRAPTNQEHRPPTTQQRPIPQQQYGRMSADQRSRIPIDDLDRMSLHANHANQGSPRPPILGVQSGSRNTSGSSRSNTMMAGQPFGLAPESSRAPPYDPVLWNIFCQVDSDGSGSVTEKELSHALINGDFTSFNLSTVALMIKLFDEDRNGTISFAEFEKLWKYLLEWKSLFARFDVDHSGTICFQEFSDSLVAFGYRLSTPFTQFLFRYHDRERKKEMSFDLFVQACVLLRMFTDIFKKFDTDQDGVITIGFEDFLKALIRSR